MKISLKRLKKLLCNQHQGFQWSMTIVKIVMAVEMKKIKKKTMEMIPPSASVWLEIRWNQTVKGMIAIGLCHFLEEMDSSHLALSRIKLHCHRSSLTKKANMTTSTLMKWKSNSTNFSRKMALDWVLTKDKKVRLLLRWRNSNSLWISTWCQTRCSTL